MNVVDLQPMSRRLSRCFLESTAQADAEDYVPFVDQTFCDLLNDIAIRRNMIFGKQANIGNGDIEFVIPTAKRHANTLATALDGQS